MHIEFLVEEPSAKEALDLLVPKIAEGVITWDVHPFQGKHDLLANLLSRLRGYRQWLR